MTPKINSGTGTIFDALSQLERTKVVSLLLECLLQSGSLCNAAIDGQHDKRYMSKRYTYTVKKRVYACI